MNPKTIRPPFADISNLSRPHPNISISSPFLIPPNDIGPLITVPQPNPIPELIPPTIILNNSELQVGIRPNLIPAPVTPQTAVQPNQKHGSKQRRDLQSNIKKSPDT